MGRNLKDSETTESEDSSEDISTSYSNYNNDSTSSTMTTTSSADCTKSFCESQLDDSLLQRYMINVPDGSDLQTCNGCTITVEVVYDGEAWVGIGFSEDGMMVGSEAVIGIPGDSGGIPQKYTVGGKDASLVQLMPDSQQTLTDASIDTINGQTILKFTKIMEEQGEITIKTGDNNFLYAYGTSPTFGYHSQRGSYLQNISTGSSAMTESSNKSAWLAHGIMAFLAWGVLVPFAVQASLLRGLLPQGSIWFNIHRAFNSTSYALTVAGFAIAVKYYGSDHFDDPHPKMGLAILIMASFQVSGGIFRPHAPQEGEEKKVSRSAWEVGHRIMGVTLLACGFWQMMAGLELYFKKYSVSSEDENKFLVGYYVWIGLMSFIIVAGGVYSHLQKQKRSESEPGVIQDTTAKEELRPNEVVGTIEETIEA